MSENRRSLLTLLPAFLPLLAGCVPPPPGSVPDMGAPASSITHPGFPNLDPGAKEQSSLHFDAHSYGVDGVKQVSDLAESLYAHIMNDTGLYSFIPQGLYTVYVYGNQEEYLRKTGMPSWSGGVTVGNAIYTFNGPQMPGVLAHEMTHLVFHEYMGQDRPELRWINEGLAVYEEQEASAPGQSHSVAADWSTMGGLRPVPFDQMISLAPMSEEQKTVSAWYAQVGSVARFMIEHGGRVGFSQFLRAVHGGRAADEAVHEGFPGVWDGLKSLETAWLNRG